MFKIFVHAMILCSSIVILHAASLDRRDEAQDGPGLPGGATDWAGSPEVPNAWKVQVRRGPGGQCPDPNPHPENDPQGILAMTHEPNGPNRHPDREDDGPRKNRRLTNCSEGPKGMSFEYYISLMDDHYAGPNGMD